MTAFIVSPRAAGATATALALLAKTPLYANLPQDLRLDLARLQQGLTLSATGGRRASAFDPVELAEKAGRMKPLLVTHEVTGELLSCSTSTVTRLVRNGDLTTVGDGRGARVVLASVEAYVERAQMGEAS